MKWETLINSVVGLCGAAASYLFGGWSALLNVLLTFVVIDYLSGVLAAGKEGNLNSTVGAWGIVKKVAIFLIVAIAHLVDRALGDAHLFRDAAIFFYLSNELLSITENLGRLGAPIPPGIQRAIEILKEKGESK